MKKTLAIIALIASASTASAGLFDRIKDAITGHTDDIIERVTVDDQYAPGNVQASNNFRTDDVGNDAAHWVKGTAQTVRDFAADKNYVQLQNNFKAGLAPDLYIYISLVDKKIVDEQSFNSVEQIELGKLVKGKGASFYEVPAHINIQDIQSITIWCKRFSQFMGSTNV